MRIFTCLCLCFLIFLVIIFFNRFIFKTEKKSLFTPSSKTHLHNEQNLLPVILPTFPLRTCLPAKPETCAPKLWPIRCRSLGSTFKLFTRKFRNVAQYVATLGVTNITAGYKTLPAGIKKIGTFKESFNISLVIIIQSPEERSRLFNIAGFCVF